MYNWYRYAQFKNAEHFCTKISQEKNTFLLAISYPQGEESSLPPRCIFIPDLQGVKISDLFNLEVHNLFQECIFICYKSLDFRWCTKHFMMTSIIYYVKKKKKDFIKLFYSNSKINVSLLTARHQCSSLCKWIGTNNFSNEKMSICFVFIKNNNNNNKYMGVI